MFGARRLHEVHVCRFCEAVERSLAKQPPSAVENGSVAVDGPAWVPSAEALAGSEAMGDSSYLLDNADALTNVGMEGQRRSEVRALLSQDAAGCC
jgi:hypothetical protein